MSDNPTLIAFEIGYAPAGNGSDGLPIYEEVVKIRKSRPPYLEVYAVATEEDIEDNPDAYRRFQRESTGRKLTGSKGYPLVMWPALNPAELASCLAREVYTVEDLAKLTAKRDETIPAPIVELAKRAKKMVELMKSTGKFEDKVTTLEGQIAALREQNNELRTTIQAQEITIDRMRSQVAASQTLPPVAA